MHPYLAFGLMVVVEVAFLFFVAYATRSWGALRQRLIIRALVLGLVLGVATDYIFGAYLGLFDYTLGFGLPFIVINGIFSYGCMIATVGLLQKCDFIRFYLWTALIGVVYEAGNSLLGVWHWTFLANRIAEYAILILVIYFVGGVFAAFSLEATKGASFRLFGFR